MQLAERGAIELFITYSMLLELEEVLAYKRLYGRVTQLGYTPSQLASYALTLATPVDVARGFLPIVQADPDDDVFLLCAAAAQAHYVVTHDRHLLALVSYKEIPIATLDLFLAQEFGE
ncbi:MAG: PIN domain-containing protein [Anaerolineales bacterium]|nr:PIN domain-containing protein [Anaerolineales bacterium]